MFIADSRVASVIESQCILPSHLRNLYARTRSITHLSPLVQLWQ